MIRRITITLLSLFVSLGVFITPAVAVAQTSSVVPSSFAQNLFPEPAGLPKTTADQARIQTIVNLIFGILGATALIIITIAGFRFVIHQGEPAEMTKQRNSIVYAVIGLVVALSAWAIVSFVLGKI